MSSPFPTLYRHLSFDKLDPLDLSFPHPLLRTLSTDSQSRSISRGFVDLTRNTSTGLSNFHHLSSLDNNIILPTFESRFITDSNKFQHPTYPITSASSFSSTTSIPTTDPTPFRTSHSSSESLSDSDTDEDMDHITNTRITQLQSMLATRLQDIEIHRTHVNNYQSITERMTHMIQQQQEMINQLMSRCGMEYKYESTRPIKRTRVSMEQDNISQHLSELHNNMNTWEQTYTSIMSHITSSSNDTSCSSSPIPRVKSEYGITSKQVKGGREAIPLISNVSASPCLTLTCPIELDAKAEASAPSPDERIIRVMGNLSGDMYIPATDLFPLMGVAKRSVSSYLANYPLTERARMAVQCQRKTGHTLMTEVNVLSLDGIRRMFTSIQRPHTDKLRRWLENEINHYRSQISPEQTPVMMGDGATSLTTTRTRISPKRKNRDE